MKNKLTDRFLSIDGFGSSVNFLVKGNTTYKTAIGALITIVIFLIFTVFGVTKFLLLYGIQETKHTTLLKERIIPGDQSFNMSSTNFNIAVTIFPTNWTGSPTMDYSKYLQIVAEEFSWTIDEEYNVE